MIYELENLAVNLKRAFIVFQQKMSITLNVIHSKMFAKKNDFLDRKKAKTVNCRLLMVCASAELL